MVLPGGEGVSKEDHDGCPNVGVVEEGKEEQEWEGGEVEG